MSTAFFWDREQKRFIFERRGIGLSKGNFGKDLTYVFESFEALKEFLEAEDGIVIVDEYDTFWTVGSIRKEMKDRGCIIIVPDYYSWGGGKDGK
ncbi:MAG: hypothetical protein J7L15_00140 [Clostridiales bacterium]|nr:hypothetical protein [Clostridiales bacterium]